MRERSLEIPSLDELRRVFAEDASASPAGDEARGDDGGDAGNDED